MRKHLLLLLLLFSAYSTSFALQNDYVFRTFSPEGGFYYDGVKSIQQDKDGFIWVLMDNDLFRFDGYQYKRYYTKFPGWDKASDWCFNSIVVDNLNRILVATNDGLYSYNKDSDSFEQILTSSTDYVGTDNKNNIWIKQDNTLGMLDVEKKIIYHPNYDGEDVRYTRNILCSNNDDLYVFSNYGKIYRFDYARKEFSLCFTMPTIDNNGYVVDARINKGKLWILIQRHGLFKIDLATFRIEEKFELDFGDTPYRKLYIDKNESIWIGTMDGIYILNTDTKDIQHYQHSKFEKFSLPNNSVWTIAEDWQKNVWIGTYSGGLSFVNIDEKAAFKTYTPQQMQLNHAPVSSFAEDKNYLWIGTEGGGINQQNKATGEFTYHTHSLLKNSIGHNNVKSLALDNESNLWIGSYTGGLDCYNTQTGNFTNYKSDKDNREGSLLVNSIRKICLESDSGLWITYQYKNLVVSFLSFKDQKFTHYRIDHEDKNHYIFDVLKARGNQLWMLSRQRLFVMNTNNREIKEVPIEGLSNMNAHSFCMDDAGHLWIGTVGQGLIKYDTNNSTYSIYKDILKTNVSSIYGVCYDDNKGVWMGTDKGLYRYDITENNFSVFDKHDGVQGLVYYPLSVLKGLDNKIYFGGTNGFTVINSRKITNNEYKPNVIISDFFIDNIPVRASDIKGTAPSSEQNMREVTLNHDQTNFGFKFSADNYLIPEKNQFKYRLKGYDEDWIETGATNRQALYSKVPAGTYYFEIIAANNDGVWSDTPTVIKVIRKPAPWFSWPAYLLYAIIALGILYLLIQHYTEKKRLKFQLYLDGIEQNKKEEIHESQLRFFTNISHDFRTPLSLIIAAVDRMREDGLKEYYYRILNGNSQRLLNLVNELMDFRAVENGKMALKVSDTSVNGFIQEVSSSFVDYAKQHKLKFELKLDNTLPNHIYIDRYIMEKVIMNLLNNAFKYTSDGGNISIESYSDSESFISKYENNFTVSNENTSTEKSFAIVVRDTGVGISKESITHVFERFYKVKTVNFDSHLGTGIGLALVKSLTLLHKGSITMFSERDQGTDIIVRFPLAMDIYSANEIAENTIEETAEDIEPNTDYDLQKSDDEDILLHHKKRILLAEDNDDLRGLIAETLSDNYEVIEAENGKVAEDLINRVNFDLIISDIMMPFKDGVALCQDVKNNVETSHIPFFILSAKTSVESKIEGTSSGADAYFEKPVDFTLLKLSIENIFKQQVLLREHYAKNYFAANDEVSLNEHDNKFLKDLINIIEENLDQSNMDVNFIASELSMSRSKLYNKVKSLTNKSIVEFILNYRMRKAARLIIEEDMSMRQVMTYIGIESQAYFTNAFKKEFGKTPTAFAAENKNREK